MDWFKEGENSRYSSFHWQELKRVASYSAEVVKKSCANIDKPKIGIVGFGFGREARLLLDAFDSLSPKIVGLDINQGRFCEARERLGGDLYDKCINPVTASMNHIPLQSSSVDATLCLETMMHSDDPDLTLCELTRITKPGGLIVASFSLTQGKIVDYFKFLKMEGIKNVMIRIEERLFNSEDNSARKTNLHTEDEIQELVSGVDVKLIEKAPYLDGCRTTGFKKIICSRGADILQISYNLLLQLERIEVFFKKIF